MPDEAELQTGLIDINVWFYAFIEADDAQKTTQARTRMSSMRSIASIIFHPTIGQSLD